jgi:hypothetical protein
VIFTSTDYDKFRALRVTHVATRFEELLSDEANDTFTPERLFLTAVDDALEQRRINKVDKLIRHARFPIPTASIAEIDYREGRGITAVRMRRYSAHDWGADSTNVLIISRPEAGKPTLPAPWGSAPATTATRSSTPVWTSWPASWSTPAATASPTKSCSTICQTPTY